jgi:hypothetical protein
MRVDEAHQVIAQALSVDVGRFYSQGHHLSLGVGKFYSGVRFPVYDIADCVFQTAEGMVLVLTHECDIDSGNQRPFNDFLLVCPVIRFEVFVDEYSCKLGDERLRNFLVDLGRRTVSRVAFIPWGLDALPYGGLLYLNQISSTHLSAFRLSGVELCGAATAYALIQIDHALTNHLLRPKAERLAFEV